MNFVRALCCVLLLAAASWSLLPSSSARAQDAEAVDVGSRLELFVDRYLIDSLNGARLQLHNPHDEGTVIKFDKPWEGAFVGYCTIIRDGELFRAYYRGMPSAGADGSNIETTCYAESRDGVHWTKPDLGIHEVLGTKANNAILAKAAPLSHNFAPMLDRRPDVPKEERFKALGGTSRSGLVAFVSADGTHWKKLREEPVITKGAFDSQNVAFWSEHEEQYLCYFRTFKRIDGRGYRWISRTKSKDFVTWTEPVEMQFGDAPPEHLYTNQTNAYFRAPHLYIATAARFMPGRRVLNAEQAKRVGVDPGYFNDCSDGVLLTSRGGNTYQRTFLEGFIRPGIGLENWVSRTNYPARNVVQTGPAEMSVYVQHNYGQPTAHLRRYSLRLDGFASVRAPYAGGEMITKPITFSGKELVINFATSAPGEIRIELQSAKGKPRPGFALDNAVAQIGNDIERVVSWKSGSDVSSLAGTPIRLRCVMKDADLFSIRFR